MPYVCGRCGRARRRGKVSMEAWLCTASIFDMHEYTAREENIWLPNTQVYFRFLT